MYVTFHKFMTLVFPGRFFRIGAFTGPFSVRVSTVCLQPFFENLQTFQIFESAQSSNTQCREPSAVAPFLVFHCSSVCS